MTGLTWGVKRSFVEYVAASGGSVSVAGATATGDAFVFSPSADAGHALRFEGEVLFSAHHGMLAVHIKNPAIEQGGQHTLLTIDDPGAPGARLPVAHLEISGDPVGGISTAHAILSREGARLFGDFYPTGTILEDVSYPAAGLPRRPTVAIVGSGPSGCYTAQALLKLRPDAEVVVFERLPIPYGLVRYGIAADHQGTKAVCKQFDRIFERGGAHFVGNVTLGADISLDELRATFDAVVVATGLPADRPLAIPGADLAGVYGSGALTRHLNGHPDDVASTFALGSDVVVVGAGNVAIDIVRMLAKDPTGFDGSDLHPHVAHTTLTHAKRITVVARSSVDAARCDTAMVKELGRLADAHITVEGPEPADPGSPIALAFGDITTARGAEARIQIDFLFGFAPIQIHGTTQVDALQIRSADGDERVIPATSVISAIGYEAGPTFLLADALPADVFRAGWAHFGPRGALPDARLDGKRAATEVVAHWDTLRDTPSRAGLAGVRAALTSFITDFDAWRRIDEIETESAPPDRVRKKILTIPEMLSVAGTNPHGGNA